MEEFEDAEIRSVLDALYSIEVVLVNPANLGWASRRKRKFLIGLLRGLNLPICDIGPFSCSALFVQHFMHRVCDFAQTAYLISSLAEQESERLWASSRYRLTITHHLTTIFHVWAYFQLTYSFVSLLTFSV